jgi:NAD(P)H dehydrogenase (quinone)
MKKIMITGATGGLGSEVVCQLKAKQPAADISILVRNPENETVKAFARQGINVQQGSYDDYQSLVQAFQGIEVLYFVSGNDILARAQQHENVINAAKEAGVQHILYTSTVRKDESATAPLYPVVGTHVHTENMIKASGMKFTLLRHNLYAEVVPLFLGAQVAETKTVYLPAGTGKTAFVARTDFAAAAANILSQPELHENKIYELNGAEQISFEEIGTIIATAIGAPVQYVSPDVNDYTTTMKEAGLPDEITGMLSMFGQAIANTEFDQQSDDLVQLLGRQPQSVKTFIQQAYSK